MAKKKSLKDVLYSDVSLSSLKDLLTTEISIPFGSQVQAEYEDAFTAAGHNEQEMAELVQKLESQGRSVEDFLVEKGFLSKSDLLHARAEAQSTGLSFLQTLVNLKICTPAALGDILTSLQREIIDRLEGVDLEGVLLGKKLATQDKLEKAKELAQEKKITFEQALLESKVLSFEKLSDVYQEKYSIATAKLNLKTFDESLINLLPEDLMRSKHFVPFGKEGDSLLLAMADPRDSLLIDKIKMATNADIVPHLADARDIEKILSKYLTQPTAPVIATDLFSAESLNELQSLVESESTVKMVTKVIEGAVNARATDIHLEPQEDTLRIRYRIDGMLYDFMTMPKERSIPLISRLKVLAGMDISERRRPQDGHISMQVDSREIDLRLATLPTVLGEKIVLRVLEEASVLKGLNLLGFEEDDLERVRKSVHAPNGMVLVTGPIGSGKTTTLYSALSEVNVQTRNIVTIEDPVEYQLPGINQVQVDIKIGLTFAEGLRAVLRQDANVLMVGEIRDVETAKVAVRAALTGHLLLSTLHTNSALGAISTLHHLGIEPILLSSAVTCVIAQRLVRKVCQKCCQMRQPSAALRKQLGLPANSKKKVPFAKGCKECFHTGYSGRTAVYEVICVSDNLSEMILQGASEWAMVEAAKKDKGSFLLDNGKKKVLAGITTFEELVRTIYM